MTETPPEDPRDALIREQASRIAALDERVTALEALVAELRERLGAALRAGSRNSGNSSMPPSGDDLPGRKPPRKERRAAERAEKKRSRGKQPGSPGAARPPTTQAPLLNAGGPAGDAEDLRQRVPD